MIEPEDTEWGSRRCRILDPQGRGMERRNLPARNYMVNLRDWCAHAQAEPLGSSAPVAGYPGTSEQCAQGSRILGCGTSRSALSRLRLQGETQGHFDT